ncbi:hypothetical protein CEUSTIGMA_g4580.t1 [Chlamydomonas eustigma]|uniref:Disease resistance R13L4/SHOC-2-like LRR domain-containing protein n=1 Tax=Chlamydomonas eustigma TaxID=1157962 RepID=A0A250X208_9CHLO|nr:hypothetical protein CEUSTIGMA_g4580.t1 [Chlamydomonas eustigma]|eukprot:GAX77134.1 hypothetical protein CEUSTIGMA_g4580.t1 [Chlamydomonas eustigma]
MCSNILAQDRVLPFDVLVLVLTHSCLSSRHKAQARIVCKGWASAVNATVTNVLVNNASVLIGQSSSLRRDSFEDRVSRYKALSSLWLGPAALRVLIPSAAAPSLFALLHACCQLQTLVLQPDAQECFCVPQEISNLHELRTLAILSAQTCNPKDLRQRRRCFSSSSASGSALKGGTPPSSTLSWTSWCFHPLVMPEEEGEASTTSYTGSSLRTDAIRPRFIPAPLPLSHLTSLEMSGYGETGLQQLPGGLLSQLRRLAVKEGDASPLQAHWKNLRGMESLILDACVGVEPLLSSLSELQALTLLRIANLDFAWWAAAGQSSASPLWRLTGLRSLDISGNYSRSFSNAIGALTRLTYLNLSNNMLDELPGGMAALSLLKVLDMSHNNLTELPFWLPALQRLSVLQLRHNQLDSSCKLLLQALPRLRCLSLVHNKIHWWPSGSSGLMSTHPMSLMRSGSGSDDNLGGGSSSSVEGLPWQSGSAAAVAGAAIARLYMQHVLPGMTHSSSFMDLYGSGGSASPAAGRSQGNSAAYACGEDLDDDADGLAPEGGSPGLHDVGLQCLDLTQNKLLGPPTLVSGMTTLVTLKMRRSLSSMGSEAVSCFIASMSSSLTLLRMLDLSSNGLDCDSIAPLWRLGVLQQLVLEDNVLVDLPLGLARLRDVLEVLDLKHNRLQQVPIVLRSLRSLDTLCLGSNWISSIPDWIQDLKVLRNLDISRQLSAPGSLKGVGDLTSASSNTDLRGGSSLLYGLMMEGSGYPQVAQHSLQQPPSPAAAAGALPAHHFRSSSSSLLPSSRLPQPEHQYSVWYNLPPALLKLPSLRRLGISRPPSLFLKTPLDGRSKVLTQLLQRGVVVFEPALAGPSLSSSTGVGLHESFDPNAGISWNLESGHFKRDLASLFMPVDKHGRFTHANNKGGSSVWAEAAAMVEASGFGRAGFGYLVTEVEMGQAAASETTALATQAALEASYTWLLPVLPPLIMLAVASFTFLSEAPQVVALLGFAAAWALVSVAVGTFQSVMKGGLIAAYTG